MSQSFAPRSLLFVPGDRPDRFDKALASGADAICLDLEDAVAAPAKAEARRQVMAYLAQTDQGARITVRLSALTTPDGLADLLAVAEAKPTLAALMLAKADHPAVVAVAATCLANAGKAQPLMPLIESAAGLRRAPAIARVAGVIGLAFGPLDLAAEFGAAFDGPALQTLRLQLRAAAAEAQIEVWDGPLPAVDDTAALTEVALGAAALGFTGKLCIHPRQVEIVNTAFTPAEAAVAFARRVVEQADATSSGAFLLDGKMIDPPVVSAARRVLARVR